MRETETETGTETQRDFKKENQGWKDSPAAKCTCSTKGSSAFWPPQVLYTRGTHTMHIGKTQTHQINQSKVFF